MIGLPVNEHSLVSKVNLDTVLWEEIVQFGSIEIALDYVDNVDISREKSLGGLIKLLRRVVIEHLIIITPFIQQSRRSIIKIIQPLDLLLTTLFPFPVF